MHDKPWPGCPSLSCAQDVGSPGRWPWLSSASPLPAALAPVSSVVSSRVRCSSVPGPNSAGMHVPDLPPPAVSQEPRLAWHHQLLDGPRSGDLSKQPFPLQMYFREQAMVWSRALPGLPQGGVVSSFPQQTRRSAERRTQPQHSPRPQRPPRAPGCPSLGRGSGPRPLASSSSLSGLH